jgi:hypothetical protein
MHVRYCPACREEFRPEIVSCSDCGATLEDRYEDQPGPVTVPEPPADAPQAPREGGYRVFNSGDSAAVRRAAARLARAGIGFRVDPGFDVVVSQADIDAAAEALRGRAGAVSMTPEADAARNEGRCPACDAAVPAGTLECPDCGLAVGDEDEPPGA